MPPKTLAMMSSQSTLRRDNNINIVDDNIMQDLQVVMMGQLRGITD